MLFTLLGVGLLGLPYYRLSTIDQLYSDDHLVFGTTGTVGIACGIAAVGLFLSNFGYLIRKHVRFLDSLGTLRLWLDWHVISAFLGSAFVALHANFSVRNWIALTCVYAIGIMLVTGLVGRYLLRFVPRTPTGNRVDEDSFENEILAVIDDVRSDVLHDPNAVKAMQQLVDTVESDDSLPGLGQLRQRLRDSRILIQTIEHAMHTSEHPRKSGDMRALHRRLAQLGRQAAVIHWAGRMMDSWRSLHRAFALLLLVGMCAHVGISLYYGYGAIWQ